MAQARTPSDEQVIGLLKGLSGLRALVIGDTIIDEYHYCEPMGKSRKELLVTTRYLREKHYAGARRRRAHHAGEHRLLAAGGCKDGFGCQPRRPTISPISA